MARPKHLDELITEAQTGGGDGRPRSSRWVQLRVDQLLKWKRWESNAETLKEIQEVIDLLVPFTIPKPKR